MSGEWELLRNDLLEGRRWFSRQRASKIAVVFGFLTVVAVTIVTAYSLSLIYFRNLSAYGIYGTATASYLIHAALLVTGFLATASAAASTLGFLLGGKRTLEYLKTLPIGDGVIVQWFTLKSSIISTILLSIFLIPVLIAYAIEFSQAPTVVILLRSIAALLALATVTHSIGSSLAFFVAPRVKQIGRWLLPAGAFIMLTAIFVILRVVFPPTLATLYYADSSQFERIYRSLPLSNPYLPTLWITLIVIGTETAPLIISMLFAVILAVVAHMYQKHTYTPLYQTIMGTPSGQQGTDYPRTELFRGGDPLVRKDILSIFRTPSEVGYLMFLLGLAAFFFMMVIYAGSFRYARSAWGPGLITFALGWLLFFTTAFMLRLIFPLMAREVRTAWYLFTLPLSPSRIVISKLKSCMVVSSYFGMFAVAMWGIVPIPVASKLMLIVWSCWTIGVLSIIHSTLGMIGPNFMDGSDPEKASTSGAGIAALCLSTILIVGVCYTVYGYLKTGSFIPSHLALMAGMSIITPVYLLLHAFHAVRRYQF